MICKIWPIKAGRGGAEKSLKDSIDYIKNDEKTESGIEIASQEEIALGRTVAYMANEYKIGKQYISGYLCDPELAIQEFRDTAEQNLSRVGKTLNDDSNVIAFHIIQSFPDNLDIDNDLVHQCGLELCEKLGLHQAVVCSHIHPAVNEKTGEITGVQKHNHILINAHCLDPEKQYGRKTKMKYNNCKESYAKLREYNDEIALKHGLPIIEDPANDKSLSWYEKHQIDMGESWKQTIRDDIDSIKRISKSWDEFKEHMEEAGYSIREGKYITYHHPDKKQGVRNRSLGIGYGKEELENYWKEIEKIRDQAREEHEELRDAEGMGQYYYDPNWTSRDYKVPVEDERGKKRNIVELIFRLAVSAMIANEPEPEKQPQVYAKVDYAIQNMINTMKEAQDKGITNLPTLESKFHNTGIEMSKVRSKKTKMEKVLTEMDKVREMIDAYNESPSDAMKELLAKKYYTDENRKKTFIQTKEDMDGFVKEHKRVQEEIANLESKYMELKTDYRDLKRIQHGIEKAQDENYCCFKKEKTREIEMEPEIKQKEEHIK